MSVNILTDLAVLGITHHRPLAIGQVASIAKSLVPELWNPTNSVIFSAVRRNIQINYLKKEKTGKKSYNIKLTKKGHVQLQNLLLCDPGELVSPTTQAVEAIQFCLLDAASPPTAEMVLIRLQNRQRKRLEDLQHRCLNYPHNGRYLNLWMGMEQRRIAAAEQMLTMIYKEAKNLILTNNFSKLTN